MRINCPLCGERPSEEFTMLGDANPVRPDDIDPDTMERWYDYVYLRENPKGKFSEYWHHGGGCRSWLIVERDTQTHNVYTVSLASQRRTQSGRGKK